MSFPAGWHGSQWSALGNRIPEDRPVECDNCDWKGQESAVLETLYEVDNLSDRLDPGSITPVGTCPRCGAFVYFSDVIVAFRQAPNVLDRLVEETFGRKKTKEKSRRRSANTKYSNTKYPE